MKPIPSLVLIPIFIFSIASLLFWYQVKYRRGKIFIVKINSYKYCLILLSLLFSIFASYDGDWYHYYDIIAHNYPNMSPDSHLEEIHKYIILYGSFGNYLWWRVIIWGLTYYIIFLAFKRIKRNDLITWACFIAFSILQLSTGRVSLGIALLFYGTCCIIRPKYKIYSTLKGILLLLLSLFFHKSLFIYFIAVIFAFFKYKKWFLITSLVVIPLLVKVFTNFLIIFLINDEMDKLTLAYLDSETSSRGIGILLYSYINRLVIVSILILSYFWLKYQNYKEYSTIVFWQDSYNLIYMFTVVYLALTINGIGSSSISARIINGIYLPISVLAADMIKSKYLIKLNLSLVGIISIINFYRLCYAFYLQRMGLGI